MQLSFRRFIWLIKEADLPGKIGPQPFEAKEDAEVEVARRIAQYSKDPRLRSRIEHMTKAKLLGYVVWPVRMEVKRNREAILDSPINIPQLEQFHTVRELIVLTKEHLLQYVTRQDTQCIIDALQEVGLQLAEA